MGGYLMVRITALVDNNAYDKRKIQNRAGVPHTALEGKKQDLPPFRQEFGLSLFIETEEQSILFDTGAEGGFLDNADALNLPVRKAGTVILSHGHKDHCLGLLRFIKEAENPYILYMHRDAFRERYWFREDDGGYYMPTNCGLSPDYLMRHHVPFRALVPDPLWQLSDHIYLMAKTPRISSAEPLDVRDQIRFGDGFVPDPYQDEMTLLLDDAEGLILITGCAHLGLINLCTWAEQLFHKPVLYYIGGTHLVAWGQDRIDATIDFVNHSSIKGFAPCHCTGDAALSEFKKRCPSFLQFGGGTTIEIGSFGQ